MGTCYVCYVCEEGWILIGKFKDETRDGKIKLSEASVVRCWSNGLGIGGIAKREHKGEYELDEIGDVLIGASKVLFEIPCEW